MSVIADIRNSAVAKLVAANVANGNVYNSKVTPAYLKNTPCVMVQNDKVQATQLTNGESAAFTTVTNLQIVVVVSLTETWADTADALIDEVLNTLMTDSQWIDQFTSIEGYTVDWSFIGDQQSPAGAATITVIGRVFQAYA